MSPPPKIVRCRWCLAHPIYRAYHDEEWGVPLWDDRALFEKLVLDGFQAGLSWLIVLRKRAALRTAFDGFDPERIARYRAPRLRRLLANPEIIRNRAKVEAARENARAFLRIRDEGQRFADYLWGFVDGRPIQNRWRSESALPAESKESRALARELRRRGFKFCGPVIVYAFMQAVGMVNDHVVRCFRHAQVRGLSRSR